MPSSRAATPVVGTVLTVALVLVVSTSIAAVTLDVGSQLSEPSPIVAFETDVTDNITFRHAGGETIDGDNIEINGGTPIRIPEQIRSGDSIEVSPDGSEETITVVWNGGSRSARLASVDAGALSEMAVPTGSEPEPPDFDDCMREAGDVIDANGNCVVVLGTVSKVTNASSVSIIGDVGTISDANTVFLASGSTVDDITDVTDLYLYSESQVTGEMAVDNIYSPE